MSKLRIEEIDDCKVLDRTALRQVRGGLLEGFPFRESGFSRDLHRQVTAMMPSGMSSPGFPFAPEPASESTSESWSDGYHSYQSDSNYYSTSHSQSSDLAL
jgi:hypothetical protein